VDSQIDDLQLNALKIDFDTLDVPSSQFITGGAAWKLIREGEADPDTFGILDMHGVGFVKGNLIRDLTSLTKTPLLPWDCWGIILEENPGDVELLDRVAEATQPGTEKYDEIMELSEHPLLKVPDTITSLSSSGEPVQIRLKDVVEKIGAT